MLAWFFRIWYRAGHTAWLNSPKLRQNEITQDVRQVYCCTELESISSKLQALNTAPDVKEPTGIQ